MEENRTQLRRTARSFILLIYLFFTVAAVVAFFVLSELEQDGIVRDTQLERGIVTFIFLLLWTLICYRLYRINMRIFDLRSQAFDAREAEHYAAKEAARLREQFMANMSHEIRTPLNAIIGFGSLLLHGNLNERGRELASNIKLASENLLAIVNDILDFSKIEAGMLVLENVPFDLNQLFHAVQQLFVEKAKQKKLALEVHLAPGLPERLVGDPTRLTQILVNLVGNALKFTERGGVVVSVVPVNHSQVTVGSLRQNNYPPSAHITLRIEVRDSGIGIPMDKQEQIFERFTQSDEQTTRIYGGTGLGLSIVKQLVYAMKGSISLKSQVGKGSVFSVLLPFDLEPTSAFSRPLPEKNATALPMADISGVRLLVAEDNPMNRRVVELLLDEMKCRYTIVQNGREAVERLSQTPTAFDVVLMDIQMPEMDGYEATKKIRRTLGLEIPIVAMTAHALVGEREKCLRFGMNDYLAKPVREQELNQIIARFARKASDPSALEMDRAYLRETTQGNPDYQRELAHIFLTQVDKDMDILTAALSSGDLSAAAKAAHNMKSTVSYMGFAENIGQRLAAFEQACREGKEASSLLRELQRIGEASKQAQELVKKEFGELGA